MVTPKKIKTNAFLLPVKSSSILPSDGQQLVILQHHQIYHTGAWECLGADAPSPRRLPPMATGSQPLHGPETQLNWTGTQGSGLPGLSSILPEDA